MIGPRVGPRVGFRVGLAAGLSEDQISPPISGGGIPGVTRDATSGIYAPANATEWTALMAAAGLATGNPGSTWNMQEASGNLADSIGTVTLTQTGAGHLYQQPITGWSRLGVQTVDGTANQKWVNTTTANNPNVTDVFLLGYVETPAASPAAVRDVMTKSASADCRFNTTGKLRGVFGASADLATDPRGRRMPIGIQVNNTGSVSAIFTDQDAFIGTYVLPASAIMTAFGGQTTNASATKYFYGAEFGGAAARLSTAQVRTLYQTLGWTIPW